MATLLEQGIAAAKQGRRAEARALFEQVLLADDRNERAWLWMSEVADTVIEKIAYVERALDINPQNKVAQRALKELKAQLEAPAVVPPSTPTTALPPQRPKGLLKGTTRKPFRLPADTPPAANGDAVHHRHTIGMPPAGDAPFADLRQAANGRAASTPATPAAGEDVPMLPIIVFGVLTVTAVGGIVMLLLLVLLS
ncbi:MAG: tetratricopeptide repeat protein [Caldilineae bacterium]|nr:MAG: tetratricopeptide repeat protein [Caldilineae bacterium]